MPGGEELGAGDVVASLVLLGRGLDAVKERGQRLPHSFVDVSVLTREPPAAAVLGAGAFWIPHGIELPEEPKRVIAAVEVVAEKARPVVMRDEGAVLDEVGVEGVGERAEAPPAIREVAGERLEEAVPLRQGASLLAGRHERGIGEGRHDGRGKEIKKPPTVEPGAWRHSPTARSSTSVRSS